METLLLNSLLIVVGLVAGVVGGIVGGGGMLTIPLLFFLGLDSATVIGTASVASLTSFISAAYIFVKSGKVKWKTAKIFMVLVVPASIIGSYLVLITSNELLKTYIAMVMLLCLPLVLKSGSLGLRSRVVSSRKRRIGLFLYFLAMINATVVPAGAAIVCALILIGFLGFEIVDAHATSMPARILALSISCSVLLYNDNVNIPFALVLGVSTFIGGLFGAELAVSKGSKWVKTVFVAVVVLSVIKMFFEL